MKSIEKGDVMETKKEHFIFSNCDTVELASRYGTPLYVVSEDIIKEKCKILRDSFLSKYNNTRAAYASKAFLTLSMCKIIEREGLDLDVVSGGELYTAIKAGFPMERVLFHGNNKTRDELELAIENNVGRIIVDNFYELQLINEIGKKHNRISKVQYRITPGVESETHKYISTGQVDSKFGIPIVENIIFDAIQKGMEYDFIDLTGFHFHVGSQIFDNKSHIGALDKAISIMKEAKERFGFITRELNTGGGFGIYYSRGDNPQPITHFTDGIMGKINESCTRLDLDVPTIMIEPGRWIVGEAGITLYTIGVIKEIPGVRTYIGIDGGMTDNPRPALYGAKYEAIVANKANKECDRVVTVAGKCCETGDILIWNLKVPAVESGDILAVLNTGAYNYTMANNYNKIPRPAVILVSQGEAEIIVERETYGDLIARDCIPKRLR